MPSLTGYQAGCLVEKAALVARFRQVTQGTSRQAGGIRRDELEVFTSQGDDRIIYRCGFGDLTLIKFSCVSVGSGQLWNLVL